MLRRLRKHEKGPTAFECGLIAAVIAISGTAAVDAIGTKLTTVPQASVVGMLDGKNLAAR